jgi:protein-S-isoprenylcysteine O-methyltransferase Ste14
MIGVLKKQNGMNIVGQGGKIILFTLPSLVAAILLHVYWPHIAGLPKSISFIKPLGYVLLPLGLALWGAAVVQLLTGFSAGRLVTRGAYGIVRNPIYSSATFFILPGIALLTLTWVYLVAAVFLFAGVTVFIGTEEKQLTSVFGKEYEVYMAAVDRLIPFRKP